MVKQIAILDDKIREQAARIKELEEQLAKANKKASKTKKKEKSKPTVDEIIDTGSKSHKGRKKPKKE